MTGIIKVDTIQNNGGTTGLTIDSSGRVVLPQNKVAFQAMRTGNITGYDGGSGTTNEIVFNNEIYDISGNYDPATGLFTAPVDGMYTFYGGVYMDTNVLQLWPLVNDVRKPSIAIQPSGATIMGSAIIKLDANDTVGLKAYTNNTDKIIYANSLHTVFTGCLTLPL